MTESSPAPRSLSLSGQGHKDTMGWRRGEKQKKRHFIIITSFNSCRRGGKEHCFYSINHIPEKMENNEREKKNHL
jgi:hypothetical protein